MLLDPQYSISPYHLSLFRLYEVLDFVDFPFLQVDVSSDGKYYLNCFVANTDEGEHRLLCETSFSQITLLKLGLTSVQTIFAETSADHIYSIITNREGIQKAFHVPKNLFKADGVIPENYFIELAGEFADDLEITPFHAKYFAYELTKRAASSSSEKLAAALVDAQVELNPHQVDAALFAFQSPLSKGVILADEVGLGKTIEAGLVISQKWAERKRKILVIVPANLRKQWNQELLDKFFISSFILEAKSFNEETKKGNFNPFVQKDIVVICSYQFVKSKEVFVKGIEWDLVVIDEAHRLRNVYKAQSKTANIIKNAVANVDKKILLTATPLQNSLLELYGLVSVIDEYAFGDLKSFRSKYARAEEGNVDYSELKERLKPICKRTLRKQVLAYVPYTNRISFTEDFVPSEKEQRLYELVSEYLQSDRLYALPSSQRQLMTLILRRLLASSTYAISGTLRALSGKLENILVDEKKAEENVVEEVQENYEEYDEVKEEWEETEQGEETKKEPSFSEEDIKAIHEEKKRLDEFLELAESIQENSKGKKLLTALKRGFEESQNRGAQRKAIIFTESTRTQSYILDILSETEYADRIVLFNGSNNDAKSNEIYKGWFQKHAGTDKVTGSRTADKRAALVEYFKNDAEIMIATEAAAEGINLQFCSLVVNYDLPWNPQRIEQRIGRCHRYGQKHDVVVVNFLNRSNEADQRVYELLRNKFQLFDGVFGASDEVLGTLGSGVDFEKRIADIYQNCRDSKAIKDAFDLLQKELETEIDLEVSRAKQTLLENFDEEVNEKLKIRQEQSISILSKYESWLWNLSKFYLKDHAQFFDDMYSFILKQNPFPELSIHEGPYRLAKNVEESNIFRISHPLAQAIIEQTKQKQLPVAEMIFDYTNTPKKITVVEDLKYQSGWLLATNTTFKGFEETDAIVFGAITDEGKSLDNEQASRFFSVLAKQGNKSLEVDEKIKEALQTNLNNQLENLQRNIESRNNEFFQQEVDKLHNWADDRMKANEKELKDVKERIKILNRDAKKTKDLKEQLQIQKELTLLTSLQKRLRQNIFDLEDDILKQRNEMISAIEKRMNLEVETEELFTIRWTVI